MDDPGRPIYRDNAPCWAKNHGYFAAVGAILALIFTAWMVVNHWNDPNTSSLYIITALWAVIPPVCFWLEFYFVYKKFGVPGTFDLFVHGQQVCAALWLGVLAALAGILQKHG
jgi:hypothetical protein